MASLTRRGRGTLAALKVAAVVGCLWLSQEPGDDPEPPSDPRGSVVRTYEDGSAVWSDGSHSCEHPGWGCQ